MPFLNVFNYLKRPEYVFRPSQVLKRFSLIGKRVPEKSQVTLPWGATVEVRPHDNVGNEIFFYGIFDRIVPEAIFRLADPGELLVEAGANIGQNCSLMVYKAGPAGRVIAFEPHPEIFQELQFNAGLWSKKIRENVQLVNVALGATSGEAWLTDGEHFSYNRGTASLVNDDAEPSAGRKFRVEVRRLDEYLPASATVGVCKIDVEGHELSVLQGAEQALSRGAIRDVIFEDFSPMPSPVVKLLQKHHFTVLQLGASWWRPHLTEFVPGIIPPRGFSHNYLATLDLRRAKERFQSGGWRCLTSSPPSWT